MRNPATFLSIIGIHMLLLLPDKIVLSIKKIFYKNLKKMANYDIVYT